MARDNLQTFETLRPIDIDSLLNKFSQCSLNILFLASYSFTIAMGFRVPILVIGEIREGVVVFDKI